MGSKLEINPWLSIWTEPRKTIRAIIETNPKAGFLILCAIYGLPMAFNLAQNLGLTTSLPVWAIIVGSLVICTFLGMIGISISAWLLQVTGRWIGGKGNFQTIRAAVAWSNVPTAVTVLMWVVLLSLFGGLVFTPEFTEMQFIGFQAGIVFLVFLVQSVVSIWGFIILLHTLGEVQGFSAWKALLNVIIPVAAIVVIWLLIGWAFMGTGSIQQ